jgi:hypothetical protein
MTHGIDQQSSSITLVKDVYWYDFTTAQIESNKRQSKSQNQQKLHDLSFVATGNYIPM